MSLFDRDKSAGRLPVSLVTGFLGSGKTTLINRLLRQPGMADTAVVVNEFGDIALDHLLVETPHEEAIGANGVLSDLAIYVEAAERGDFCSGGVSLHGRGETAIRSRVLHSGPDEGGYRK